VAAVAAVFSIGAMVAWLVIDHELWERPGGRVARDRARLCRRLRPSPSRFFHLRMKAPPGVGILRGG
jgi:hypothetical protein